MEAPPSATSATTVGGCTFDELCNGTVLSYACDYTVDIRGSDFEQAKQKILTHIDDCIIDLEIGRERKVEKLYIGKTYVHRRRAPRGFVPVDPKNHWTYRKDGIGSRWREHRNTDYGRDGMIVLAVIPREAVPSNAKPGLHQEDYTFALEQALLHHFMITNYDGRIANDSFATGGTDVHGSAAYALYMAFRLEDEEDAEGGSDLQNSSDSDSDVILVQGDTDLTQVPSTSQDDFTMPEFTAGTTHHTATTQDNVSEIQGSQPNSAGNTSSTVQFQNPLVSNTHVYENLRPNRKRKLPKRSQTPYAPSGDVYDFDNHSDSTDEHFDHCLTGNRDTHDHPGFTDTSWTDSANTSSLQSRQPGTTPAASNSTSAHSATMIRSSSATSTHPTTSTYPINEPGPSTTSTDSTTIHGTPSPLEAGSNIHLNSLQQQVNNNTLLILSLFVLVSRLTYGSNEFPSPSKKRKEE